MESLANAEASGHPRPLCQSHESPRDELESLSICLESINDLLIPEKGFEVVDRSNFAYLFGYLVNRQKAALEACLYGAKGATG